MASILAPIRRCAGGSWPACRAACSLPIIAKLTPNVTDIATIAQAAEAGGADAISLINTCLGMAVDWRRRRPLLGNVMGGLSGPAIKPIALRAVYQVAQAVKMPRRRDRRHRDDRRRDGVPRRRGDGRPNRHRELLQSHGVHAKSSTPCPAHWPDSARHSVADARKLYGRRD